MIAKAPSYQLPVMPLLSDALWWSGGQLVLGIGAGNLSAEHMLQRAGRATQTGLVPFKNLTHAFKMDATKSVWPLPYSRTSRPCLAASSRLS
jgi:hypothetical protein